MDLTLGPFSEIYLNTSEQGKFKAYSIRREFLSNKAKANYFGTCVQIGKNNPETARWVLCNEQENNSIRLEDFSEQRTYPQNVVHFHLDNPLLYSPQILVTCSCH